MEEVSRSGDASASDHALEDGEPITDHVKAGTKTIDVSGFIIDKTGSKRAKLEKYRDDGKLLDFNFTSRLQNAIILKFDTTDSAEIKDGYKYTMSLRQIKVAIKAGSVKTVEPKAQQRTKKKKNAGRVQPKKKNKSTKKVKKK